MGCIKLFHLIPDFVEGSRRENVKMCLSCDLEQTMANSVLHIIIYVLADFWNKITLIVNNDLECGILFKFLEKE